MYVCVGLASPFSLQTSIVSSQSAFALGLELAIVAPERNANAPRLVQFRAKGRAPDDAKEPPIQAHALGDTSMRVRPVESVAELSALIGSQVQHAHPPTHAPKPHAPRPTPSDRQRIGARSVVQMGGSKQGMRIATGLRSLGATARAKADASDYP